MDSTGKRKRDGGAEEPIDTSAALAAQSVSLHYSSRQGQAFEERKRSDVISLREYNNWVRRSRRAAGECHELTQRPVVR
jgi:hypothetical protein